MSRFEAWLGSSLLDGTVAAVCGSCLSAEGAVKVECGADQRQVGQCLGEVSLLLPGAADLLGIQAQVVGVGEHLLERQPRLVQRLARVSASTYQNEHAEKVPSWPRSPSGLSCGSYR